ncbi:MAG: arylsulfatase [Chitinophagales bacterium]
MQKLILLLFALLLSPSITAQESTPTDSTHQERPNIVLILVDDAALMDFGCYGGEASTPNIDRLAKGGTMFTNYHTSPMCAPSRSMLLTGYDSHLTGVPNLPLFLPPEYAAKPGYSGVLNNDVWTVATRLKKQNYRTYITGKWHLGHSESNLPSKRGFDRTYILDASGADNYEQRPYLPTQESKPPWYKDGQLIDLPEDFYSSRNLVDEMIQFMEETPKDDKPFFSFLSFQAIHIPVQVPKEYTEKYIKTYEKGWGAIRQQRYENAKKLGIIPVDAPLGDMLPVLKKWDDLSEDDKKYKAKAMAVNAGMLEAMDFHIGRYIEYLKENNQFDNTVFIITSDNGPEASSVGSVQTMKWWLKYAGYHQDYERLGERGSFNYIGPEFASAAASPSAYFKFYAGEGGLRVPLIFSGPNIPSAQSIPAFSMVTDVTPTILSLAGAPLPAKVPAGSMTGKNLYPLIQGETDSVYRADEAIGMEAAGQCVLYKGEMKLVRNGRPYGDGVWRLYNLTNDPGETTDLSKSSSKLFAEMTRHYSDYTDKYGVLEMGIDYQPLQEIQNKMIAQLKVAAMPWLVGFVVLVLGIFVWRWNRKK